MTPDDIVYWALSLGRVVLTTVINWFEQIHAASGTLGIWMGIIVFVGIFSIILIPLRGGADVSSGALFGFVMNRVNRRKPSDSDD